jgi:hypothetical protein
LPLFVTPFLVFTFLFPLTKSTALLLNLLAD